MTRDGNEAYSKAKATCQGFVDALRAQVGGLWLRPAGVEPAPLLTDPESQNLVTAPKCLALAPGDWIIPHPRQAHAVLQFENILLVRGGRLQTERWRAFPRRY